MFKFYIFAVLVAMCAAKPGNVVPLAYSTYPGVSAYSAYPAVSAYSALPAAYSGVYPGVSAYSALPNTYSGLYPGVSAYSAHPAAYTAYSSPLVKSQLAYTAGVPVAYSGYY